MDKESKAAASVEKYTQLGSEELQKGNLAKATELFEVAYKRSELLADSFTSRVCAFNLGAVYIAHRQPEKGLAMLQHAIPPMSQKDGKSNGDLFYNFGLAHELQRNPSEAAKYFELALEEYGTEKDNIQMEAEVSLKLGYLYFSLGSALQSARCQSMAATSFGRLQNFGQQALCLCQQALALVQGHKLDDALEVADHCMILCQRVKDSNTLGKVYNELGLIYTQCRDFPKAATCFELGLPLSRGPNEDKKREAVILQNLGAVYNSLGDYQRSLNLHESAAKLHAELGNRAAQGQCFTNLAFTHSQLGNHEMAGESYLHALLAAKDTNDLHAQWQAAEGLGVVAFHEHNVDKAIRYFKQALSTLALSQEKNPEAQERIVAKLTDCLEYQATKCAGEFKQPKVKVVNGRAPMVPVSVLVNNEPRPPTRQEQIEMDRLRKDRKRFVNSKNRTDFDTIALGIGLYDSDSDLSVNQRHHSRPGTRRSASLRRQHSAYTTDEVDTRRARSVQGHRDQRYTASDGDGSKAIQRRLSTIRRNAPMPSEYSGYDGGRRHGMRPLLREDGHDSENEWRDIMKEKRGHHQSSSDEVLSYRERLNPPSTPDFDEVEDERQPIVRKSRKTSEKLSQIPISPRQGQSSDSESDPAQEAIITHAQIEYQRRQPPRNRPMTAKRRPQSDLNDTGKIIEYENHLRRREAENESGESDTDPGSRGGSRASGRESAMAGQGSGRASQAGGLDEQEQERHEEAMGSTLPQHSPPSPPDTPPSQPLVNTYEIPQPDAPEARSKAGLERTESTISYKPGKNYFRMDSKQQLVLVPEGNTLEPEGTRTLKQSMPQSDDPDYMTIRTVQMTRGEDDGIQVAPEPPPLRSEQHATDFEQLSRAEQERILYDYQKMRDDNMREKIGRAEDLEEEGVALPGRGKQKQTSRMCVVM